MQITLLSRLPLEGARKDITVEGQSYDATNPYHYSMWALAYAQLKWKEGDTFELEELQVELDKAKTQQTLDDSVKKGLMNIVFDPETQEEGYQITEKGREWLKRHRQK